MYAHDAAPPPVVTVPPPSVENPAAGTTGNPNPRPGRGDGRLTADDLPVPLAVAGWALAGLAVVVVARYGLRKGAIA